MEARSKASSLHARGRLSFSGEGVLRVMRDNTDGKFEIHLRSERR